MKILKFIYLMSGVNLRAIPARGFESLFQDKIKSIYIFLLETFLEFVLLSVLPFLKKPAEGPTLKWTMVQICVLLCINVLIALFIGASGGGGGGAINGGSVAVSSVSNVQTVPDQNSTQGNHPGDIRLELRVLIALVFLLVCIAAQVLLKTPINTFRDGPMPARLVAGLTDVASPSSEAFSLPCPVNLKWGGNGFHLDVACGQLSSEISDISYLETPSSPMELCCAPCANLDSLICCSSCKDSNIDFMKSDDYREDESNSGERTLIVAGRSNELRLTQQSKRNRRGKIRKTKLKSAFRSTLQLAGKTVAFVKSLIWRAVTLVKKIQRIIFCCFGPKTGCGVISS